MKRCTKCGELKPPRAFHSYGKARPGQRETECSVCHVARARQRAAAARRWIREFAAGWRDENRHLLESARGLVGPGSQPQFRLPIYYQLRHDAILAYGGYRCACCGITEPFFLSIDHVNNDGGRHRREVGSSTSILHWLRKNRYPPGFQVLCTNCNTGRHRNGGICPHKDPVRKPRGR